MKRETSLTANAGGNPPRTSPSPPVLLHGVTSAATSTMFIPCSHTIFPAVLPSSSVFFLAILQIALAGVFFRSTSKLFKDFNPLWVSIWFFRPTCDRLVLVSEPEAPWLTRELLDTKLETDTAPIDAILDLKQYSEQLIQIASLIKTCKNSHYLRNK